MSDHVLGILLFVVAAWQSFGGLILAGSNIRSSSRVTSLVMIILMVVVELIAAFRLI